MSTVDVIGWAPTVRGPFRAGRAEPAAILTCYVCERSQVFADRPADHLQILTYWTRDAVGWRHRRCGGGTGR